MAKLFDVLRKLNELDTAELEAKQPCKQRLLRCDDVVEGKSSKKGDLITIGTPTGTLHRLLSLDKKPTHAAILFVIDREEYERATGMLDDAPVISITEEELKSLSEKAAKWDKLDAKIAEFYDEFYDEDHVESDADLDVIGEAAAQAFGYL
jgi:hypothetical protein